MDGEGRRRRVEEGHETRVQPTLGGVDRGREGEERLERQSVLKPYTNNNSGEGGEHERVRRE